MPVLICLLRRVIKHVKTQNWTAVALDVEPERLRTAAETLLGNEAIAPALRFQIVEYDAHIATTQAQRNFVETGLANWLDQAGR